MSTIQASNVSDGTTTLGTSYVVNGSAKAWCNINASSGTPVFIGSMNFSSVTDQGVGDFDVDFTSAMSSANYAASSASAANENDDHMLITVRASTGITIQCFYQWSGKRDRTNNCGIVMGDLA